MNDVISLLKDFGFPAIAFGMMFWLCVMTIKNNTKAIQRLEHTVTQAIMEMLRKEIKD
jgi:hypothetical protein